MKICLNPYVEGSGIGTYTLELARYLASYTNHEIIAIGDKNLAYPKIKIYQTPKKRSKFFEIAPMSWVYDPIQDYKISKLVNRIKPDIFYTSDHLVINTIKCPTLSAGWNYPRGLIDCIRLAAKYEKWYLLPYRIVREVEMTIKGVFSNIKVKRYFGVTQHTTKMLNRVNYPAEYIPPGIYIKPNTEKKFKKITITFVARSDIWNKRKGLHHLLDALETIENRLTTDYNLILIGDMPPGAQNEFKKYPSIRKHIIIKGLLPREETLKTIKKSHLLAAPSLYDEFGFAVLEALSYGVPVIASKNNRSFREMVGAGGGILIDIFNRTEFSEELSRLLQSKKRLLQLGKNALKRVKENYSWEVIAPRLIKAFEQNI